MGIRLLLRRHRPRSPRIQRRVASCRARHLLIPHGLRRGSAPLGAPFRGIWKEGSGHGAHVCVYMFGVWIGCGEGFPDADADAVLECVFLLGAGYEYGGCVGGFVFCRV